MDLWRLPINPISPKEKEPAQHLNLATTNEQIRHTAATSLYTLPYKQQQMKYMHQTFLNLPPATLLKAIINALNDAVPKGYNTSGQLIGARVYRVDDCPHTILDNL